MLIFSGLHAILIIKGDLIRKLRFVNYFLNRNVTD